MIIRRSELCNIRKSQRNISIDNERQRTSLMSSCKHNVLPRLSVKDGDGDDKVVVTATPH